MKRNLTQLKTVAALAVITALCHPISSRAADISNADVQKLLQRIDDLEQKVKILERHQELDQEAVNDKLKALPTVSLGAEGLKVVSSDTNFTMIAHGYAQIDGRNYFGSKTVNDTFLVRRLRPIVEGTVFSKYDYRVMLDIASGTFGSTTSANVPILDDAFVNARFLPNLQVQVGKYKSPLGLERLESTSNLQFIETGYATALTPNYDVGASVHNSLFKNPIDYSIGIYNGATDGGSTDFDSDQGKDIVARIFSQPFINSKGNPLQKLGFGVAGSIGDHVGSLPSYRTPGQQTLFSYASGVNANGRQWRVDPQAFYYWGPFGLMGEYVISSQEVQTVSAGRSTYTRLNNSAWQVQGSWFLTGEENGFRSSSLRNITPDRKLSFDGSGFGAVELVGRIQGINFDDDAFPRLASANSAHGATSWGVGINWYLNSNLKLNLDYEQTTFKQGKSATTSATAHPEHVLLSQVQIAF